MSPRFASECEPPIAWSCPECGLFQLESSGRPFSPEERAAIAALGAAAPVPARPPTPRRSRAALQARQLLEAFPTRIPVDVEGLAEALGYPVRWRALPAGQRGGIEGGPDRPVLVLNREYPFRSDAERRWAVAEELAHAVLGHSALVASEAPGQPPVIREPARALQEREARVFAAELLMPAGAVRRAFEQAQTSILRALGPEERARAVDRVVGDLAEQFRVSRQAMRLRLTELELLF
ncbi:MAG: ImmA/IrrE family metallo-endopeptidase [Armatimonadota bacterium]|nr:ImmA/IrrE family metallo-endopeptidase [Armatimonadota bacterium]MDR7451822.1 ImmA/IrrE family metallo-endopeptidase [Armatimonadota bacterium]MDR7467547.1 ImmA/IrrE family metallo-endopeptidase [Armatimonadota bacterium]MDR7494492.1 ImmA/IrrE family metallo-endopeptidase [Armatimonadota bacterium]MDR7499753.1 ImmA/IrrE family metallo-endopeptidase [Armatimonadota bacterium]